MAIRKSVKLTYERLQEVLHYSFQTGTFRWAKRISIRIVVGKVAGRLDRHGHRYITIDGERFIAHRLAWFHVYGEWPSDQIDHINGNPDDNRLCNLRDSSQAENTCNRGKSSNNTSGYKGVTWHKKAKKWLAQIGANGQHYYLGLFDTAEEAHAAYCEAAVRLHGEFARFE